MIHIEPAEGALNRIDTAVAIAVELLKMLVGELSGLRIRRAGGLTVPPRLIP